MRDFHAVLEKHDVVEFFDELLRLGFVSSFDTWSVGVNADGRVEFFPLGCKGGTGSPRPEPVWKCPFGISPHEQCKSFRCDEVGDCRRQGDRLDNTLHK